MKVSWTEMVSDPLLERSHHVTVVWREKLLVHGGLASSKSPPLNSLIAWSPIENGGMVTELQTKTNSPALSHHAGALLNDDFLLLVGGWDGKTRCSKVTLLILSASPSVDLNLKRSNLGSYT